MQAASKLWPGKAADNSIPYPSSDTIQSCNPMLEQAASSKFSKPQVVAMEGNPVEMPALQIHLEKN